MNQIRQAHKLGSFTSPKRAAKSCLAKVESANLIRWRSQLKILEETVVLSSFRPSLSLRQRVERFPRDGHRAKVDSALISPGSVWWDHDQNQTRKSSTERLWGPLNLPDPKRRREALDQTPKAINQVSQTSESGAERRQHLRSERRFERARYFRQHRQTFRRFNAR